MQRWHISNEHEQDGMMMRGYDDDGMKKRWWYFFPYKKNVLHSDENIVRLLNYLGPIAAAPSHMTSSSGSTSLVAISVLPMPVFCKTMNGKQKFSGLNKKIW